MTKNVEPFLEPHGKVLSNIVVEMKKTWMIKISNVESHEPSCHIIMIIVMMRGERLRGSLGLIHWLFLNWKGKTQRILHFEKTVLVGSFLSRM